MNNIKDILYNFFDARMRKEELYLVRGTATNIDTDTYTCDVTPIDGGADIKSIQFTPTGTNKGIVLIPKDGTKVLVGFENKTKAYLVQCDEVDEIIMRGGLNGGLINISDLVSRVNSIENKVNDLVAFTATHTHTGVTTGGGSSGTTATPVTGSLTLTQESDIEDDKITH